MLTEKMTYEEMFNEVKTDFLNFSAWRKHQMKNMRRISLKLKDFPAFVFAEHTTPKKNKWTMMLKLKRKIRDNKDYTIGAYTSLRTKNGNYNLRVFILDENTFGFVIYLPHVMSRYAERMKLDLHGEELARHYFTHNSYSYFVDKPNTEYETCICSEGGIALGEFLNDKMILAKTFITYDMSLGWQVELFKKHREMVEIFKQSAPPNYTLCEVENAKIEESYRTRDKQSKNIF